MSYSNNYYGPQPMQAFQPYQTQSLYDMSRQAYNQPAYNTPMYAQPQPQQTPPYVGHPVDKLEDIVSGEVPMDGRMYFFPKADQSCVFGKYWNKDGVLTTVTYVAQNVEAPEKKEDTTMVDILSRLSSIEEKINTIVE